MTTVSEGTRNPRVGMLAIVRKRRAVISEVRPFQGQDGMVHLVRLEYKDEQSPESEELIWELEPACRLLEPTELPRFLDEPMPGEDFDALVRAARWGAIQPYLDPDGEGPLERMPISAPFHGAVQVEDYQLVPLLKALSMPRIHLMIADDVGIGKTIEVGLIESELLLRRRIQRILILTPASLRLQWRDEMWDKFSLRFDVIDRQSTQKLKRSLGIDANPWRCCSRIIASYYYLRQPDVLEQFRSACRTPEGSARLPWDLLIVDEVHNLMPSPFGEDSGLCRMLRMIAPYFEHRVFLTATPHNGHTRSFSGLLELLDPVRFTRTDELKPAERERVQQVVVRRLKREINARTHPPRFCVRRPPQAILLVFTPAEERLINAFNAFRSQVRGLIASQAKKRRLAGSFAIEILGKRLLSGAVTFAESWRRCKRGLREDDPADDRELLAAQQSLEEEAADDRETEQRQATASTVIGAWMKAFVGELDAPIAALDSALEQLGLDLDGPPLPNQDPRQDARYTALTQLIDRLLRAADQWKPDERLVVFTEYKTTLDYLLRRLRADFPSEAERFLYLFGGMDDAQREQIKQRFNDPAAAVRVLVATDAASEGLNLQSTARYVLHFDCPWNPSRLEQRNGRLDRHGQARDVHVFHFASDQDADLRFIAYLITKVDQIREDLGATGELFDEATHRCLIEGDDVQAVQNELDARLETARGGAAVEADARVRPFEETQVTEHLNALARELDLDPDSQHATLDAAMSMRAGRPQLSEPESRGRCRILHPELDGWSETIDATVRRPADGGGLGPLPSLAFSAEPFIEQISGRPIFRPRPDTQLVHLGHPLMGKAVNWLSRRRFPGPHAVSRWSVRYGQVPDGAPALVLLHLEELGVNELRETFHHWLRTVGFAVQGDQLGPPLEHRPAAQWRSGQPCQDPQRIEQARDLLSDLEPDLLQFVRTAQKQLTATLESQLDQDGRQARRLERERYASRQAEVSTLIAENSLAKLERDIARLQTQRQQGRLFDSQAELDSLDRSLEMKKEELHRRRLHYEEIREQLARERERIVNRLLPRRFRLQGQAQVFPVAIEVRFPSGDNR